jgi:c-di-GMP-related signal transduction protein
LLPSPSHTAIEIQDWQLLTAKLETPEATKDGERLGDTFFQGYHFCRSSMLSAPSVFFEKLDFVDGPRF